MIRMSTSSIAIHKTSGPHYHCFQSDTLVWVGFKPMHTHHHAVQTYNNYSKYYLHHATCALSSLDTMSHQRASTKITRLMSMNAWTFTIKKYRISDLNFDVSLFRLQHWVCYNHNRVSKSLVYSYTTHSYLIILLHALTKLMPQVKLTLFTEHKFQAVQLECLHWRCFLSP